MTPGGPSSDRDSSRYCGGPKRQSEGACTRPAGWGTDHVGVGTCKLHGGTTPSHKAAAHKAEARRLLGTLGVVDDPAALPTPQVLAEIELSAAKQIRAVRWLEEQVGDLPPGQVDGSPWPPMLRDARRDLDRLLVEMARLGLDARRVRLAEREAEQLERVLEQAAVLLGLQVGRPEVRAAIHQSILALEGGTTP